MPRRWPVNPAARIDVVADVLFEYAGSFYLKASGDQVAQQNGWLLPRPAGLYDPSFEHDACGVGFVARVSGEPGHDIVAKAVEAVANLSHRGAVAADGKSGDGSGVLTQLPRRLLARELQAQPVKRLALTRQQPTWQLGEYP